MTGPFQSAILSPFLSKVQPHCRTQNVNFAARDVQTDLQLKVGLNLLPYQYWYHRLLRHATKESTLPEWQIHKMSAGKYYGELYSIEAAVTLLYSITVWMLHSTADNAH